MADASLSTYSGGPVVLILDFTSVDVLSLQNSFSNVFESGIRKGTQIDDEYGKDLLTAFTTFGFLHRVASSSGVCDDGCVPTAVLGLFGHNNNHEEVETVWLYNSLDEESIVARGNEVTQSTERIQRQWTSNRHYDSGVLPVVIGTLRQYLARRVSPQHSLGQKRPRTEGANEERIATDQHRDGSLRTCQGAIMKALCFIYQHKPLKGLPTKSADNKKKLPGTPKTEQTTRQEGAVQLCLFCPARQQANPSASDKIPNVHSISELAQSMLAMQLETMNTRLFVGLSQQIRNNHQQHDQTQQTVKLLAALAASSGGCTGWLYTPTAGSETTVYQGPTLADHMLGYVSDALNHIQKPKADTSKDPVVTSQWVKYAIHEGFPSKHGMSARKADLTGISYIDTETLCVKEPPV